MEWFENEEFWRELYPYMFPTDRMEAAGEQVGQLLTLTAFNGRTVLDLCCGPGRHAVELARRGFVVTGVDRSPFLLDRARERAAESDVEVEWVMEDMRRFRRPASFDLVCNIFTSFGYFEDEDDDLRVLRNVRESLKDGGVFVMDVISKERVARIWQNSLCTEYPDGAMLLARPRLRDNWCRVQNEWILLKDGRARTFHFEHSAASPQAISAQRSAFSFRVVTSPPVGRRRCPSSNRKFRGFNG